MATFVILGPVSRLRVVTGLPKKDFEIAIPLIELVVRFEDKTPYKARETDRDLCSVHDDALYRGLKCDSRSEGVKAHLVVGVVLIEIIASQGARGGFSVHYEGLFLELDHAIKVTAQTVSVLYLELEV